MTAAFGVGRYGASGIYHDVRPTSMGTWIASCLLLRDARVITDVDGLRPCLRCRPDAPEQNDPLVYFGEIHAHRRAGRPHLIKVGCTRNLPLRQSAHATHYGSFRLLGTIPGGVDLEARIHAELRPWARGAEVFAVADPVLAIVGDYLRDAA